MSGINRLVAAAVQSGKKGKKSDMAEISRRLKNDSSVEAGYPVKAKIKK